MRHLSLICYIRRRLCPDFAHPVVQRLDIVIFAAGIDNGDFHVVVHGNDSGASEKSAGRKELKYRNGMQIDAIVDILGG